MIKESVFSCGKDIKNLNICKVFIKKHKNNSLSCLKGGRRTINYMLRSIGGQQKAGIKISELWIHRNGKYKLLYKTEG